MSKVSKEAQNMYKHVFAHNFLNIQWIFNLEKVLEKLRYRAFQPYHQILYILKHVGDVGDRSSTPKDCNAMYVGDVGDMQIGNTIESKVSNVTHVGDVGDVKYLNKGSKAM